MLPRRPRLAQRAAVLALVLVVGAAQVAWARAAWCPGVGQLHASCGCCAGREDAPPDDTVAGDCCAVEEAPAIPLGAADPGVVAPAAPALAARPVALVAPAVEPVARTTAPMAVEARAAGPPVWLRTRSLRL